MIRRAGVFALAVAIRAVAAPTAPLPDPAVDVPRTGRAQTAVFAGGCFWCTEAVFEQFDGVKKVVAGFSGGTPQTAHYETVCSGKTDHAESVQITFDPAKISYGQLLKVFFGVAHDPTQLNRQGPDVGRQYRSAVFYANEDQKRVAEAYIRQLQAAKVFSKPIVTEVSRLKGFYPAEEYHQQYVTRHPSDPYVVANALPKVEKTRRTCAGMVKKK